MNPPSVSIIVPAEGPLAEQALLSVLSQDHTEVELIALTGPGSSEAESRVIRLSTGRDEGRLKHLRHGGGGIAAAFNQGLASATGDLIGFLGPDDYLLPGAVSRMAEQAAAFPAAELISPWFRRSEPGGRLITEVETAELGFADALRLGTWGPRSGTLARRSFAERAGGWDESLMVSPEREWWLRDPEVTLLTIPEVLVVTSGDSDETLELFRERLTILDRFFARSNLPPEITALHDEAYAALLIEHGAALGDPADGECRFVVEDRVAARFDTAARARHTGELLAAKSELELSLIELGSARQAIEQLSLQVTVLEDTLRRREARIDSLEAAR